MCVCVCVCIIHTYIYIYIYMYVYILEHQAIGLMSRAFANSTGDQGSYQKTQKMVLDAALLNTQHYKARIKGKVVQSREWSSTLPLHLGVVAIEKRAFVSPSRLRSPTLLYYIY